ncbi:YciI family protein [Arthrobacter antioxidans]|uniref:YciI family protein n=1 Tax=Arthrobacter antioxidans TaxID=2895818 RepID=UPI001FFE46C8|nr:YciI family protein [Arthrobacter antioxidans]
MATFITIGYGERIGYEKTDPAIRNAAHEHDAAMRERGVMMGIAGEPTQVRNHDGVEVVTQKGPFLRSDRPVAGFAIVEADSIEEATHLVSQTPCAVAHGLVEVWPLQTAT